MATQFVPYSVTMRGNGYVRVPRTQKWVPAEVMERRRYEAEVAALSRPLREMMRTDPTCLALANGTTWGDIALQEQDKQDAPYLAMTDAEWHTHLRTDRSQSWEEVTRLRKLREARKAQSEVVPMPEPVHGPAYWYTEYTRYPHLYFSSEEQQRAAIAEVVAEWRVAAGRWRVAAMERAATQLQALWRGYAERQSGALSWWLRRDEEGEPLEPLEWNDDAESFMGGMGAWSQCTPVANDEFACPSCGWPIADGVAVCFECQEWSAGEDDDPCPHCKGFYCDGMECRYPAEPEGFEGDCAPTCDCGSLDCECPGQCGQMRCGCIDKCKCGAAERYYC